MMRGSIWFLILSMVVIPVSAGSVALAEDAAPAAPELRPIIIRFTGEVIKVGGEGEQPTLTLRDRYGVTKEMIVDLKSSKFVHGEGTFSLDELEEGARVSVEYIYDVATGQRHVQTLTLENIEEPTDSENDQ